MIKHALLVAAAVVVAMPNLAVAQSKGPNGGTVVSSQGHPIEFVRKGPEVVFYFGDHDGSPVATRNMKGKATIQDGGKTAVVTLAPSAPNMLVGKAAAELSPQAKVVLSATLQGSGHEHSLTARFSGE